MDPVVSPTHYTWIPGIECKDVIQYFSFFAGSAMKYIWRYEHKGNPIEDLRKARQSLDHEITRLEKEHKK